ncbi:MAG: DUF2304 domain-containing protein [Chitinophagales bacterium]|nr:DUF2304 domain-containing protein [Chitinophagales bacterium]
MAKIQLLAILASLSFLFYIGRLIVKGKLREEYSIVWILSTIVLIVFSFWRNGLEILAHTLGIYEAPNMIFTGAIFIIMIYLLHLSIVLSKTQRQNKELSQELALLKQELKKEKVA